MPRFALRVAVLAVAFALGTLGFGWWAVPLLAALWGVLARSETGLASVAAALGALLAWGALLLWGATRGPVAQLAAGLAGVMGVPAGALVIVTLLFPTALAWSASAVAQEVAARLSH